MRKTLLLTAALLHAPSVQLLRRGALGHAAGTGSGRTGGVLGSGAPGGGTGSGEALRMPRSIALS